MFMLQWRVVYGDYGELRETVVTIEETTIEQALPRYLEKLSTIKKPIKESELLCVVEKSIDTAGITK
jgi:hypothetical protein